MQPGSQPFLPDKEPHPNPNFNPNDPFSRLTQPPQKVADLIDHLSGVEDVRPHLHKIFRLEKQLKTVRQELGLEGSG